MRAGSRWERFKKMRVSSVARCRHETGISSYYVLLLTRVRNSGGGTVRGKGVVAREWSDFINSKMPCIIRCTIF